jgi:hypothetical protein
MHSPAFVLIVTFVDDNLHAPVARSEIAPAFGLVFFFTADKIDALGTTSLMRRTMSGLDELPVVELDEPPVVELDEPPIEFCNFTVHGTPPTLIQIDFDGNTPDERTR